MHQQATGRRFGSILAFAKASLRLRAECYVSVVSRTCRIKHGDRKLAVVEITDDSQNDVKKAVSCSKRLIKMDLQEKLSENLRQGHKACLHLHRLVRKLKSVKAFVQMKKTEVKKELDLFVNKLEESLLEFKSEMLVQLEAGQKEKLDEISELKQGYETDIDTFNNLFEEAEKYTQFHKQIRTPADRHNVKKLLEAIRLLLDDLPDDKEMIDILHLKFMPSIAVEKLTPTYFGCLEMSEVPYPDADKTGGSSTEASFDSQRQTMETKDAVGISACGIEMGIKDATPGEAVRESTNLASPQPRVTVTQCTQTECTQTESILDSQQQIEILNDYINRNFQHLCALSGQMQQSLLPGITSPLPGVIGNDQTTQPSSNMLSTNTFPQEPSEFIAPAEKPSIDIDHRKTCKDTTSIEDNNQPYVSTESDVGCIGGKAVETCLREEATDSMASVERPSDDTTDAEKADQSCFIVEDGAVGKKNQENTIALDLDEPTKSNTLEMLRKSSDGTEKNYTSPTKTLLEGRDLLLPLKPLRKPLRLPKLVSRSESPSKTIAEKAIEKSNRRNIVENIGETTEVKEGSPETPDGMITGQSVDKSDNSLSTIDKKAEEKNTCINKCSMNKDRSFEKFDHETNVTTAYEAKVVRQEDTLVTIDNSKTTINQISQEPKQAANANSMGIKLEKPAAQKIPAGLTGDKNNTEVSLQPKYAANANSMDIKLEKSLAVKMPAGPTSDNNNLEIRETPKYAGNENSNGMKLEKALAVNMQAGPTGDKNNNVQMLIPKEDIGNVKERFDLMQEADDVWNEIARVKTQNETKQIDIKQSISPEKGTQNSKQTMELNEQEKEPETKSSATGDASSSRMTEKKTLLQNQTRHLKKCVKDFLGDGSARPPGTMGRRLGALQAHWLQHPGTDIKASLLFRIREDLKYPIGVTTNADNNIVVADTSNNLIKVFSDSGERIQVIGKDLTPQLKRPSAIVTNWNNDIFVKDDICVHKFNGYGKYLTCIGRGCLMKPYGLDITPLGNLITLDTNPQRPTLVHMSQDARFLWTFVYTPLLNAPPGSKARFLAVSDNCLIVSDLGLSRVYLTNLEGIYLAWFGNYGNRPEEFAEPSGISVDNYGNMVIGDSKNNRIKMYRQDGAYVGMVQLDKSIWRPSGLHLTKDNKLIIINFLSHTIDVYQLASS